MLWNDIIFQTNFHIYFFESVTSDQDKKHEAQNWDPARAYFDDRLSMYIIIL